MNLINRRSFLRSGIALTPATWSAFANAKESDPPHLRLLGETTLPHRLNFQNTTVGGLSALDYDPVDDLWYALSDDRSDINPARFYTFRMTVSREGLTRPILQSVVFLKQADGSTYPSRKQRQASPEHRGTVPDPEGLRFRPQTRTLLWSSEGDRKLDLDPFVREMTLDGQHLREFDTPVHLKISQAANVTVNEKSGPRDNLAFEGLAISPDGKQVWAAMESPLVQDGPIATVGSGGGPCRFTCFDTASGKAIRQIAYQPDAVPLLPLVPGTYADNGVSEILMQSAQHMLVLERSYSLGAGNSLRLYRIHVETSSDTLTEPVLHAGSYTPAAKTLIANFNQIGLQRLDNTEGMAWGPPVSETAAGHNAETSKRTLVFVSDDNFNPLQTTQFIAFEVL